MFRKDQPGDREGVRRARTPDQVAADGAVTAGVSRRTVAKSAVLAAAVVLGAGGGVAQARRAGDTTPRLPVPTGPHRTGVTTLYLVDGTRRDPWNDKIAVRELMASVFYPARTVRGCPRAPQMTAEAAVWFTRIDCAHVHPELPDEGVNWAATLTHSHTDAPAQPVRRPVLLYSPGGGDPRTTGTAVAEELASHGYVVVTIDHPGDGSEVEFPVAREGRDVVRLTTLRDPAGDPEVFRTMIDTRIADTRFVLDQLELLASGRSPDAIGRPLPKDLGRALDLRRVGVYGHSAGGTTAAQALYQDRRVRAAVNLEGYLDHTSKAPGQAGELFPVARDGVDRPLLLVGTDGFRNERIERSCSAVLAHPRGCVSRREIEDADHWVFTDYAALAPQLEAAGLMTADGRTELVGPIDPERSVPLVRGLVRSFFARHLRSR